ncbi:anti-adapter protein IraM, partial [Escherichia coli]|nr:anti-adapter protein IraM [Escherichia coli]
MKCIVIDTVIQPSCGIYFSVIWSDMKMIIWY